MVTTYQYPNCFFLCSFCFWGKYSYNRIWNYVSRNCLLGHRKKIAKFLTRTFTCRSTFLYGPSYRRMCIVQKGEGGSLLLSDNCSVTFRMIKEHLLKLLMPCRGSRGFLLTFTFFADLKLAISFHVKSFRQL